MPACRGAETEKRKDASKSTCAQDVLQVAVVDKRGLASGSTVASTALVQYEIDTPLLTLTRKIGKNNAVRAWRPWRLAARIFAPIEMIKVTPAKTGVTVRAASGRNTQCSKLVFATGYELPHGVPCRQQDNVHMGHCDCPAGTSAPLGWRMPHLGSLTPFPAHDAGD